MHVQWHLVFSTYHLLYWQFEGLRWWQWELSAKKATYKINGTYSIALLSLLGNWVIVFSRDRVRLGVLC